MTIQLIKNGKVILFDSIDWALVANKNWHVDNNGYAIFYNGDTTHSENCMNKTPRGKSKYLGVSYQDITYNGVKGVYSYSYIKAKIRVDNKLIHLGTFRDEESAALAYNVAAKKYFGEFANLNII